MFNPKGKNVVAAQKARNEAAAGSDKPYFQMVRSMALGLAAGEMDDKAQKDFYAWLSEGRPDAAHATILDSRASESWSIVKLGLFPNVVKALFDNMATLNPTPTGLYDIACSLKESGRFAKGKPLAGKGIGLKSNQKVAPSAKAMKEAMQLCNRDRNNRKVEPVTFDGTCKAFAERLARWRDGKVAMKDAKGETIKGTDGKAMKYPKVINKVLDSVIVDLLTLSNAKVASIARARKNGKGERKAA